MVKRRAQTKLDSTDWQWSSIQLATSCKYQPVVLLEYIDSKPIKPNNEQALDTNRQGNQKDDSGCAVLIERQDSNGQPNLSVGVPDVCELRAHFDSEGQPLSNQLVKSIEFQPVVLLERFDSIKSELLNEVPHLDTDWGCGHAMDDSSQRNQADRSSEAASSFNMDSFVGLRAQLDSNGQPLSKQLVESQEFQPIVLLERLNSNGSELLTGMPLLNSDRNSRHTAKSYARRTRSGCNSEANNNVASGGDHFAGLRAHLDLAGQPLSKQLVESREFQPIVLLERLDNKTMELESAESLAVGSPSAGFRQADHVSRCAAM